MFSTFLQLKSDFQASYTDQIKQAKKLDLSGISFQIKKKPDQIVINSTDNNNFKILDKIKLKKSPDVSVEQILPILGNLDIAFQTESEEAANQFLEKLGNRTTKINLYIESSNLDLLNKTLIPNKIYQAKNTDLKNLEKIAQRLRPANIKYINLRHNWISTGNISLLDKFGISTFSRDNLQLREMAQSLQAGSASIWSTNYEYLAAIAKTHI